MIRSLALIAATASSVAVAVAQEERPVEYVETGGQCVKATVPEHSGIFYTPDNPTEPNGRGGIERDGLKILGVERTFWASRSAGETACKGPMTAVAHIKNTTQKTVHARFACSQVDLIFGDIIATVSDETSGNGLAPGELLLAPFMFDDTDRIVTVTCSVWAFSPDAEMAEKIQQAQHAPR
jgi:hypothetical protein